MKVIDDLEVVNLSEVIRNYHNYTIVFDSKSMGNVYLLTSTRNTHYQWSSLQGTSYYNDYSDLESALKDVPIERIHAFLSYEDFGKWLKGRG